MKLNVFPTIKIKNINFHVIDNVTNVVLKLPDICEIDMDCNKIINSEKSVYLMLNTPNHHSFGHWFFESCIYYKTFFQLKKIFPNLKIVLANPTNYKLQTLNYFGINEIEFKITSSNNLFFIPIMHDISLNNEVKIDLYDSMLTKFYLACNAPFESEFKKKYDITIIPRHKVENNPFTDRIIDTIDIENEISKRPNCLVYDTSKVKLFKEQIDTIRNTHLLIVPDGSSLLVNGFFARDSIIIALGFCTPTQSEKDTPKLKNILKKIAMNNIIIFIHNKYVEKHEHRIFTYDMIKHIIETKNYLTKMKKIHINMYLDDGFNEKIKNENIKN